MKTLFLISASAFLASMLGLSGSAQETIKGEWTGEIKIGKETIPVTVRFGAEGNTGAAEVSGQQNLALKNVGLRSNRVHFELPIDTGTVIFDGQLKGVAISGEVQRANEEGTFALVRVAQIDPKVYDQYVDGL